MPIYEYACESCQSRFEIQQKMSDPPLTTCSKCGHAISKLISPPAIMFKGSGWYVTDYSDKMKPPSSAEAGESKDKAKAKESTGEAKPAAGTGTGTGNGAPSSTPAASPASSSGESSSGGSQTTPAPPKTPSST